MSKSEPVVPARGGSSAVSSTLLGLVSRYSPTGSESAAVNWLTGRMRELGYQRTFVDLAGNAVGMIGDGPRQVVLLGHIDTVPGEIPVRVEGDALYARGSVDAKGSLAAFVDAAAQAGPAPGWQFVVIGAVDEEGDSRGAREVISQYQPQFALIGEPSRWDRVTLGYKGSAWARVRVSKELAHPAGQGQSACEQAVLLWNEMQGWAHSYNAGREKAFDQLLLSLRGMNSGEDGFQEWAELRVGARLPVGIQPQDWYRQLEDLCQAASVDRVGYPIPAYQAEKNNSLVRSFLNSLRAAGAQPHFVLKTGTADLNLVAPAWGCPAVAYGPGDSALDHTPNEHLSLQEYERAVGVLVGVLHRLSA